MLFELLRMLFQHAGEERDTRRSEQAARLRRQKAYENRKRKAKKPL